MKKLYLRDKSFKGDLDSGVFNDEEVLLNYLRLPFNKNEFRPLVLEVPLNALDVLRPVAHLISIEIVCSSKVTGSLSSESSNFDYDLSKYNEFLFSMIKIEPGESISVKFPAQVQYLNIGGPCSGDVSELKRSGTLEYTYEGSVPDFVYEFGASDLICTGKAWEMINSSEAQSALFDSLEGLSLLTNAQLLEEHFNKCKKMDVLQISFQKEEDVSDIGPFDLSNTKLQYFHVTDKVSKGLDILLSGKLPNLVSLMVHSIKDLSNLILPETIEKCWIKDHAKLPNFGTSKEIKQLVIEMEKDLDTVLTLPDVTASVGILQCSGMFESATKINFLLVETVNINGPPQVLKELELSSSCKFATITVDVDNIILNGKISMSLTKTSKITGASNVELLSIRNSDLSWVPNILHTCDNLTELSMSSGQYVPKVEHLYYEFEFNEFKLLNTLDLCGMIIPIKLVTNLPYSLTRLGLTDVVLVENKDDYSSFVKSGSFSKKKDIVIDLLKTSLSFLTVGDVEAIPSTVKLPGTLKELGVIDLCRRITGKDNVTKDFNFWYDFRDVKEVEIKGPYIAIPEFVRLLEKNLGKQKLEAGDDYVKYSAAKKELVKHSAAKEELEKHSGAKKEQEQQSAAKKSSLSRFFSRFRKG